MVIQSEARVHSKQSKYGFCIMVHSHLFSNLCFYHKVLSTTIYANMSLLGNPRIESPNIAYKNPK